MRIATAIVLVCTACGTDVRRPGGGNPGDDPNVDAGPGTGSDGEPLPDPDGGVPSDGIPSNLTPCEEAAYHSDLEWIQSRIFTPSCTSSSCHDSVSPGAGMSLVVGASHGALVNVASTTHSGWTRVVPRNPGASMLMVQIGGEPGPELEGFMPWGQPRLCEPMIDAIRRWIANGAQP